MVEGSQTVREGVLCFGRGLHRQSVPLERGAAREEVAEEMPAMESPCGVVLMGHQVPLVKLRSVGEPAEGSLLGGTGRNVGCGIYLL